MRKKLSPTSLTATVACLAIVVASCGGSDSAAEPTPTDPAVPEQSAEDDTASVIILQSRFGPAEVTVPVGGTVSFVNNDAFGHTVTSKADQAVTFASDELGQDDMFDVTFGEAGTFAYFCEIHPTMRATVVVN